MAVCEALASFFFCFFRVAVLLGTLANAATARYQDF